MNVAVAAASLLTIAASKDKDRNENIIDFPTPAQGDESHQASGVETKIIVMTALGA